LNRRPTVYETVALPLSYIGFNCCAKVFSAGIAPTKHKADVEWFKTPNFHFIRHESCGNYFGRVWVIGK
jgi:hypothetical protein